jgi:malate synthase
MYIEAWLSGLGAVAIYNLMEDTATAEISRAQLWQWIHNDQANLDSGKPITVELYKQLVPEELAKIETLYGPARFASGQFELAKQLLDRLVVDDEFVDFLTLIGYEHLP